MTTSVDIVIPVLNEERALPRCISRLAEFVDDYPERDWNFTVADNGSTDRTPNVARELAARDGAECASPGWNSAAAAAP